jgi:hypothetical protein
MISRRLWSVLRRLASCLWESWKDVGLATGWVDPMLLYATYERAGDGRQAKADIGHDGPGHVPASLRGPPPGHPEQLVSDIPLTPAEIPLWRELEEEL